MQSDRFFFLGKPALRCGDQEVGNSMNNAPLASSLGRAVQPTCLKPSHSVEFQPSVTCPRNFIIFDQTDNRRQIMFHPVNGSNFCYPGVSEFRDYADKAEVNKKEISSAFKEDSDDIDALLSLEEESHEEFDEEEVSTARTDAFYGSSSPESCSNYEPRRKSKLPSLIKSTGSATSCSGRKRNKMRKMVKALKGIVPGANQMSTVAVLDEAVKYLKSLKVEMQKLGVENMKSST